MPTSIRNIEEIKFLDRSLELNNRKDLVVIDNPHFSDIGYLGRLLGMVCEGKALSTEATLETLSTAKNIDELIEIIRFVVGPVWLYIYNKNEVIFLSSLSAPPLYLYRNNNKLYFTRFEYEICTLAIREEMLNPFEIFDIFNTVRFDSVPYGSLFNNILRIPGGHFLNIKPDFNLEYQSFLNKPTRLQVKYNYNHFKDTIESVSKLYIDSGDEVFLYFSGGMDSTIVYLALKEFSDNINLISTSQDFNNSVDGGHVWAFIGIADWLLGTKTKVLHADRYSKKQREIRDDICRLLSSNQARWDSFLFYTVMDNLKDKTGAIFLTGNEMDDGYGIAFTKFRSGRREKISGIRGRYFYSKYYQKHLVSFYNKKYRSLHHHRIMDPKIEYLTCMIYMKEYQQTYHPLIRNKRQYPPDFLEEYEKYKEDHFLKVAFKDINQIKALPPDRINNKIRILRHYLSVPNVLKHTYTRDQYQNLFHCHLPTEGPMIDIFCNLEFGWKDVYHPKRFLHKYFKEKTGKTYTKYFTANDLFRYYSKIHNKLKGDKIKLPMVSLDRFTFSEVYRDDFTKNVDLHNPLIFKYLDNSYIKKFVEECYDNAIKGFARFDELQNIYNMELFLRNTKELSDQI